MTVYQGERFITAQLKSILPQLSDYDEVIIVDDGCADSTPSLISALQDSRLIVVRKTKNEGILRGFETALSHSSGEVIFLSDSDDIWLPKKVETVLEAFAHDDDLMLVASDAILIDADGNKIGDSFYAQRGKFRAGLWSNLLVGKFHGCTMAFRSSLLRSVLPFPPGRRAHQDTWIGCVNALLGGKTKYIPEPLVAYRRHSSNDTGLKKNSNYTRLRMRLPIVLGLLKLWIAGGSRRAI